MSAFKKSVKSAAVAASASTKKGQGNTKANKQKAKEEESDDEEEVFIPLDDLIGDTTHLMTEERTMIIKGLELWSCKFYHSDFVGREKGVVIGLHGGPAFCHNYILPLKLLANFGWSVILYDQIGCGKSTFVEDPEKSAPWLLTLEYYLDELKVVVENWSVPEYFLYGSSWALSWPKNTRSRKMKGL
jgi:pimeloyl-ACP methyl ester carboxylesterase